MTRRYVYHAHGHINMNEEPYTMGFEGVYRLEAAITDDTHMEALVSQVTDFANDRLGRETVAGIVLRGVSHLHTIKVDDAGQLIEVLR